ncbi:PH domain-containing protein [Murimonas intestini]|uniref:PH (Pleckstrin Homology) domain-containing protein n=1 Tax=Murimonas intestini TaxID=1337051 RepID=A0AB73T3Q0_9FIRM|nr:PH domain-containing protein [Murimonas intestini]MCR1841646.1 PH domain-containing protein [Murimonas intestini]MCR1868532.1 PH domain-containing protein [Murimonas intestini]MCR1886133.1 PH domain-containing protein [Murimonas intestini]
MKFKGKIALWFWIIFLGGESLILYKMAESIFSGHDTEDIIVLAISFVIYTLVFLPIVARNYVLIEDGKLKLFFGFSTDVIDISEIREIRSTCSPIASSAASLDRLVIKGRRQEMIVSVKDKQKFLEELKKRI